MEVYIRLAICVISIIAEVMTAGLAAIWFAPAALISVVLAMFKVSVSVQIPVFIIASGLFMLLFYKKVKDNIDNKSEKTKLIIPSELQNLASMAATFKQAADDSAE